MTRPLIVACLGLLACAPAPPVAMGGAVRWAPCAPPDTGAECTTLQVPLSYADPASGWLRVAVRRHLGNRPGQRQLWYLAGGPGGAGTTLIGLLQRRYGQAWEGVDLYTLDHRGTGGTGRLSCPDQEAPGSPGDQQVVAGEVAPCLERIRRDRGAQIRHLTVSDSARDLHRAITALRGQARVFFWGNSFGTYWALRYLELFPDAVDGVFLEALVPSGASYRSFDHWMNDAGMRLLGRCAGDPGCRSRFAADPVMLADRLSSRLAAGHCRELGLPVRPSWLLGSLLYDHHLRGMVPLLVHMMDRCHPQDVVRLRRLYRSLFRDRGMLTAGDFSAPLYAHVIFSEMWSGEPPGGLPLADVSRRCLFCPGDRAEMDRARPSWPTYRPEAPRASRYVGPLWMLQGGLDPAIPPATAASLGPRFRGAHQHYLAFAEGAHTLTGKTPTPEGDCALSLLSAFLRDPRQSPPLACMARVAPPPLPEGPPGLARSLLGPGDLWGGR